MSVWLTRINGQRGDTVNTKRLRTLVSGGQLGLRDEIFDPKRQQWIPVGKIRDLRDLVPGAKQEAAPKAQTQSPMKPSEKQSRPAAAPAPHHKSETRPGAPAPSKPKSEKPKQHKQHKSEPSREPALHSMATSKQDVWMAVGLAASCVLGLVIFFATVDTQATPEEAMQKPVAPVRTVEAKPASSDATQNKAIMTVKPTPAPESPVVARN